MSSKLESKKWRVRGVLPGAVLAASCVREPVERLCPQVAEGQLVVSELRAAKRGGAEVSWIELFNAGGAEVELLGMGVRLRRLDGGAEQRLLVRREVAVAAGEYVVLGQVLDDERPAGIAYGFALDVPGPFYAAAAVELESCEVLVDRMAYGQLPAAASYALGVAPPSAAANDAASAWCADSSEVEEGELEGSVGTPGKANRSCR